MKIKHLLLALALVAAGLTSASAQEKIIIVDEGNWQTDNGRLSYFENGKMVSNQWFRDVNGSKLGDTPNDIIQINDTLLAIAINWSNIVQFIRPDGKAVAATEDIPNNRRLASDGNYVYVTSYGHQCKTTSGMKDFTKGFVAKIDVRTFQCVAATEVGYEPDGIAYYNGHIFVANSGGYAFQEDHEYERTVSVLDVATMQVIRTVDTGQINLYGSISRSGRYLCIPSPGDYYNVSPATIIFDAEAALNPSIPDYDCFVKLDCAATINCTNLEGNFYAVGTRFSYTSGTSETDYLTINPRLVFEKGAEAGIARSLPGSLEETIRKMSNPYDIYVNPYTGYLYATDAGEYVAGGKLYQWNPKGTLQGSWTTYINPGHLLALPPDGMHFDGVEAVDATHEGDGRYYNLMGLPVANPEKGHLYIHNGCKIIFSGN